MDQTVLKPGGSCLVHRVSKKKFKPTCIYQETNMKSQFPDSLEKSEDLGNFRWNTHSSFALTDTFF